MYNRIIFILSLTGLVMGVYVLQSFMRQTSVLCLTGSGCELVRKNPASYLYGIPVPGVGVAGYAVLSVLAFIRTLRSDRRLMYGILGMSLFGVFFVTWFTYTELFIIKGVCMWCAISAVNMYVICTLALLSSRSLNRKTKNEK